MSFLIRQTLIYAVPLMIVALAFVGGALKYYLDYYYYSRWLKNNG